MKTLKCFYTLLAILTFSTFLSCKRDADTIPEKNDGQVVNSSPVHASVSGNVVDENNQAVTGATVKSGNQTTTTDSRGLFNFDNIEMDKYASVVTVEANAYFKGIRTFSAEEGSFNYIKIKLLPKTLAGTVDASAGGTVTLSNGSIVTLKENSVVIKSNGQPYTGTINVYATNIDPTAADIAATVPGSFQATDANNYRVLLKSYGMMTVQLEGQSGELLQIANNKTAKLRFVIPSSLSVTAPASMQLWYLNETDGLWKEEGSAQKTNNYYETEVSHFSFWNCDEPDNFVFFEFTAATSNGPLPAALVRLTRINNATSGYGYTNSAGHCSAMVFKNEPLLLEILDGCGDVAYSQNIGPYAQATNLGTIIVPIATTIHVTGNATDCAAQPVANGSAHIYWEGRLFVAMVTNGTFSIDLLRCNSTTEPIEVSIIDNSTHQQSTTWTTDVSSNGTVDAGTLAACGISSNEWVNYTINGGPVHSFSSPADYIAETGSSPIYFNSSTNSSPASFLSFGVSSPLSMGQGQTFMGFSSSEIEGGAASTLTYQLGLPLTITEYGNVGEYISGHGTAVASSSLSGIYTVYIDFRIKRAF